MRSTKKMILATLIGVLAIGSIGYSAVSRTSRKKAANKTAATSKNLTRKFSCSSRNVTVENLSTNKVRLFTASGNDESCNLTSDSNSNSGNSNKTVSGNLLRKFSCDGYQDITVENLSTDKVKLADGYGSIYNLNSTSAASGEKYSDGNISIHMKGNDAIYTENGKDKSCTLKSTGHGSIEE